MNTLYLVTHEPDAECTFIVGIGTTPKDAIRLCNIAMTAERNRMALKPDAYSKDTIRRVMQNMDESLYIRSIDPDCPSLETAIYAGCKDAAGQNDRVYEVHTKFRVRHL